MRTPRIACALLCCLAPLPTPAKEEEAPGQLLWEVSVKGRVMATAALDEHRVLFAAASDSASVTESALHCLDRRDGQTLWSQTFPNWLLASPAVGVSRIWIGCDDSNLYCLDKWTGEELWRFETSARIDSTPCIDTPGNCYFGSRDRFFYAVDPQGNLMWSHFLKGPIASSPVLHEREGRIYVADLANTIYAFSLEGELLWSYKPRLSDISGLRLRIYSSPALDDEGFLYVGSGDHHLYAIDRETGLLFWREDTGAIVDASPVISSDAYLYVANREGTLFKYLIEPQNSEREIWSNQEIGQVFYSSPVVDALNNIYVCGSPPLTDPEEEPWTQLSYVDKDSGQILWSRPLTGYTDASPLLDEEGNVYLGTSTGTFSKFRGAGAPLADASWPMFHGQPASHGRHEETFSQWLVRFGIPAELAGSGRDSDGDGARDYQEFIFGSDPRDPVNRPLLAPGFRSNPSEGLTLTFKLQKGIRAPYSVQSSHHLLNWLPLPLAAERYQFEESSAEAWTVHTRVESTYSEAPRFFRVAWTQETSP